MVVCLSALISNQIKERYEINWKIRAKWRIV
jgi:hypothetical protein